MVELLQGLQEDAQAALAYHMLQPSEDEQVHACWAGDEYKVLLEEHLVPLPCVFKSELRNPKWHIQVCPNTWKQTCFMICNPVRLMPFSRYKHLKNPATSLVEAF